MIRRFASLIIVLSLMLMYCVSPVKAGGTEYSVITPSQHGIYNTGKEAVCDSATDNGSVFYKIGSANNLLIDFDVSAINMYEIKKVTLVFKLERNDYSGVDKVPVEIFNVLEDWSVTNGSPKTSMPARDETNKVSDEIAVKNNSSGVNNITPLSSSDYPQTVIDMGCTNAYDVTDIVKSSVDEGMDFIRLCFKSSWGTWLYVSGDNVGLMVEYSNNIVPDLSISSPASNIVESSVALNISADAYDSDGTISEYQVYFDNTLLDANYAENVITASAESALVTQGKHTIKVVIKDNSGYVKTVNKEITACKYVVNEWKLISSDNTDVSFEKNKSIGAVLDITPYTSQFNAKILIALYNKDNTMIDYKFSADDTFEFGVKKHLETEFVTIPNEEDISGYTVKAYVFKSFEYPLPLGDEIILAPGL